MKLFLLFLFVGATSLSAKETVYCIHGFMRTSGSMKKMAGAFERREYQVVNWGYPSREKAIIDHAKALLTDLQKSAKDNPGAPIHFVTHSMGGIILRAVHNLPDCPEEVKMGKAVLLAPPNRGTKFGRYLGRFGFMRKFLGPGAGRDLISSENFDYLGQFPSEKRILIISGTLGLNPIIGEVNDGKVGVTESCLPTPHDHKTHSSNHTWIMYSNEVINTTIQFIAGTDR